MVNCWASWSDELLGPSAWRQASDPSGSGFDQAPGLLAGAILSVANLGLRALAGSYLVRKIRASKVGV